MELMKIMKIVFLAALIIALIYGKYILTSVSCGYHEWTQSRAPKYLLLDEDLYTTETSMEEPVAPCSFRRMERNHTDLWQKFNFWIPVFQWNETYSRSEYRRLSNRTLPYGWKELSEDEVKSTLAYFNTSSSTRLVEPQYREQCLRCAVVGNGGILRGSGQGRDIDSHDLVFRTNGAVTHGFVEDVGNRTSFYGFTTKTAKNSLKFYRKFGFKEIPKDPETRYLVFATTVRDFAMIAAAVRGENVPEGLDMGDSPYKYFGSIQRDHFKMVHPDFIYYLTTSFLNSTLLYKKGRFPYRPTTGALLLLTALHTCDQVSAYGYITKDWIRFSEHYFEEKKTRVKFTSSHDYRMEQVLWEEMDRQAIIRLYTRDADVL